MASAAAPISRFDLGRVVERTFSSISRNFPVFLLLTLLLAGVPALLTGLLLYLREEVAGRPGWTDIAEALQAARQR